MAVGLLILLCAVSWPGISILGRGQGELAAVTFLGISLVVAGLRAAPGCEVMAIPGLLFGKHTELGCIIFSRSTGLNASCGASAASNSPFDLRVVERRNWFSRRHRDARLH